MAAAAPAPVPVLAATAEMRNVPLEISQIGTVEPYSFVQVRTQVTGELTGVYFKEGDEVHQGQVIFSLDKRQAETDLRRAQGDLNRDMAQLENARAQWARYEALVKEGVVAREQADQVRTELTVLESQVRSDKARVEGTNVQLTYSELRSPLNGRTGNLMVHLGNQVKANDNPPLVVINQIQPIYVSFSVPQQYLAEVRRRSANGSLGIAITIPNDDRGPVHGTLTFVDNEVDTASGTIKLKGTFTNADWRLWPGQFVNAALRLTTEAGATVIPTAAVQTGQAGQFVFVIKANGSVEQRPVEVERSANDVAVIKSGVVAGERVVTDGQIRLLPGTRVEVKAGNIPSTAAPTAVSNSSAKSGT